MSGLGGEMRQSLDPMAASWAQPDWEGGRLLTIKSPQQVGVVVGGLQGSARRH